MSEGVLVYPAISGTVSLENEVSGEKLLVKNPIGESKY